MGGAGMSVNFSLHPAALCVVVTTTCAPVVLRAASPMNLSRIEWHFVLGLSNDYRSVGRQVLTSNRV